MKTFTKILSVFMAMLMVVTCIPMTAFAAEAERDTRSLEAYVSTANLKVVVGDLLTALNDRKEEIVPTVLNICFQAIDALREAAEEKNVDVAEASTEKLATVLLDYLDVVLEEADLNSMLTSDSTMKLIMPVIKKYIGNLELNSVDGILDTLVKAIAKFNDGGEKTWGTLSKLKNDALNVSSNKKKPEAIQRSEKNDIKIVYGLIQWLSDNKTVFEIVLDGKLNLGGLLSSFVDLSEINDTLKNLDTTINNLLYDNLIAKEGDPALADSVYKDFGSDALLAAALLKAATGEDSSKAEADALAGMKLNQIIAKYADSAFAKFLVGPLNTDLRTALNDLVAMDPQLAVLKNIINLNYEFKASDFNFAQMTEEGLFENLNNLVCKVAEVILQPSVYAELALKTGKNENVTANLTSVFAYILKTLAANNGGKLEFSIDGTAYSFDFSGFTADKIAGKTLEDMVVAVFSLFYPTLLEVKLPAEVKTMEQLAGFSAYVAIDKFMVKSDEVDFNKDYKNLVFANGKVRDLSQAQWNDVLGEMGMDVAIYWLNDATNFGMTQADVDALKAKGWTWEDFFEEIVDWALGYIKGIPAVADELEIERGVSDGHGPWYKLNVVLNELLPLGFFTGCGDETFTFDVYTAFMGKILPSLFDCNFAKLADIFAKNDNKNNPLEKPVISAVISVVDNLLFSIFEHDCGKVASFRKESTATQGGAVGTYCTANGHYISVTALPPTGATDPSDKPSDPSTDPSKPADPPADFVLGDITGDKKVNAADARIALRVGARLETLNEAKMKAADVTLDGKVNAADARKILRVSARLETL